VEVHLRPRRQHPEKGRFAYADTTNPLETVTYTYGDANWRDKLTAVNGTPLLMIRLAIR